MKQRVVYRLFLDFLVLFYQEKSTEKNIYPNIVLYFLCLDAKKVTKKNQGKPERSARFVLPAPHITLRKMFLLNKKMK